MALQDVRLFAFSGTGNTHRVARWMAESVERNGARATVVNLHGGMKSDELSPRLGELIGFLTPTHGFTAPWLAIKIASRLPRGRRQRAFVATTRAGSKIGPVFLPGIAASAPFLLALILFFKGYRVRGAASFDMSSNWMSLHTGFKEKTARTINEHTKPKVENFILDIAEGKRRWFSLNLLYEAIWAVLLSWISVLYLLFGRFMLAKAFFADERCNACENCAKNCPVGAINMKGRDKPRPYWRWTCESCMRCMAWCPTQAIQASHQLLILFILITLYAPTALIVVPLLQAIPALKAVPVFIFYYLAFALMAYLATFLAGWLMYAAARLPILAKFLSLTTGTRYYRRYHEPDTSRKDLRPNPEK